MTSFRRPLHLKKELMVKAGKTTHVTIQMLLNEGPAKGNPLPVTTRPDREYPYHDPFRSNRKQKGEHDIVMVW